MLYIVLHHITILEIEFYIIKITMRTEMALYIEYLYSVLFIMEGLR